MSSSSRIAQALKAILSQGAMGASVVLALSGGTAAHARPVTDEVHAAPAAGVAERLRAIRTEVSSLTQSAPGGGSGDPQLPDGVRAAPTWWGNGWHNGGWGYGWGNHGFGWPNWPNWHNGWHNWSNGWNNWNNGGWQNYWHNW